MFLGTLNWVRWVDLSLKWGGVTVAISSRSSGRLILIRDKPWVGLVQFLA